MGVSPGYIYDPARHDLAALTQAKEELDAAVPPDVGAFIRRIAGITGTPPLSPTAYATLFRVIAEAGVDDNTNLNQLSAAISELCQGRIKTYTFKSAPASSSTTGAS